MSEAPFEYDPVAKEFRPVQADRRRAEAPSAEASAARQSPVPVRRRRKRRTSSSLVPQGEPSTRVPVWKGLLWLLIGGLALALAAILWGQIHGWEGKPKGDKVLHLEREDVVPDSDL